VRVRDHLWAGLALDRCGLTGRATAPKLRITGADPDAKGEKTMTLYAHNISKTQYSTVDTLSSGTFCLTVKFCTQDDAVLSLELFSYDRAVLNKFHAFLEAAEVATQESGYACHMFSQSFHEIVDIEFELRENGDLIFTIVYDRGSLRVVSFRPKGV